MNGPPNILGNEGNQRGEQANGYHVSIARGKGLPKQKVAGAIGFFVLRATVEPSGL